MATQWNLTELDIFVPQVCWLINIIDIINNIVITNFFCIYYRKRLCYLCKCFLNSKYLTLDFLTSWFVRMSDNLRRRSRERRVTCVTRVSVIEDWGWGVSLYIWTIFLFASTNSLLKTDFFMYIVWIKHYILPFSIW